MLFEDGHERKDVVKHRKAFVAEMLIGFRRTYLWRAVAPSDPSVDHLRESGVLLTSIVDKDGKEWLEYSSDDIGECESRGDLTKDASVWTNADGTINKPVIYFDQDECIFKSNQDEYKSWVLPGMTALRPKTEGSGLMISGFRSWEAGWLTISEEEKAILEAQLGRSLKYFHAHGDGLYHSYHKFDYGKNREGYWDGEKMVYQVDEVVLAAEMRFPGHEFRFLFDWSSCHDKMPASSFNISKFKVTPGFQYTREGVQKPFAVVDLELECEYPSKPDGVVFAGEGFGIQRVRFQAGERPHHASTHDGKIYDGQPKGKKQLLWERGLLVPGMTEKGGKNKTQQLSIDYVLGNQPDVLHQKSTLQLSIEKAGHVCVMLPKFHCEMNGIERVWGRAKWFTRRFCNYTLPALLETVPRSLSTENCSAQLHRRFARKARAYMRGYAGEGIDAQACAKLVVAAKKKRLQHRSTPPSESAPGVKLHKPWEKKKLLLKLVEQKVKDDAAALARLRAL